MTYHFNEFTQDDCKPLLNEFIDNYTTLIDIEDGSSHELIQKYKAILDTLCSEFQEKTILKLFEELAYHEISLHYSYIIITRELHCLQNILIQHITKDNPNSVESFFTLFKKINNQVAFIFLHNYIKKLLSLNSIRINSISDLIDKKIIRHYESHLMWLNKLALFIQTKNISKLPQLDENRCDFGKWLNTQAKQLIHNNSKYNAIISLHSNLHNFSAKIQQHLQNNEFHILITYLEKCELLSLSIGTELALVDNIIMNKRVIKDELTGAMNRNGLHAVFQSQYELSLATGNSFVLALCDLDLFKNINDKYGHVAGDKILTLFVNTCKEYLRNSDITVRYGGEEFVLILPAINKNKAFEVIETIRKEFQNKYINFENQQIKATVSIGVVEINPEHYYKENFLNEYVNIADQKLYMAKKSGRNRVEAC